MNGIKYEIYIGLKDKDTYEEIFDPEIFAGVLAKICHKKEIGFSLTTQLGGYTHNKGYVTETSLRITLVGINEKEVYEIAEYLKDLINTDTILITKENCEYLFA